MLGHRTPLRLGLCLTIVGMLVLTGMSSMIAFGGWPGTSSVPPPARVYAPARSPAEPTAHRPPQRVVLGGRSTEVGSRTPDPAKPAKP
ncbi:MAG: hypothetical protein QOE86_228 [Solirubrobacteraceae bacterium]|jgi:hypothetical protein|nr:hypothetical protein [Solirubrobacteraceae bacterium]